MAMESIRPDSELKELERLNNYQVDLDRLNKLHDVPASADALEFFRSDAIAHIGASSTMTQLVSLAAGDAPARGESDITPWTEHVSQDQLKWVRGSIAVTLAKYAENYPPEGASPQEAAERAMREFRLRSRGVDKNNEPWR